MVEVPAIILKDQVRASVSSFSRAVEVETSTSPFNTWTEQFRSSWMVPVPMVCLSRLRSKSCLAASVCLLLDCLRDGSGFQF